MPEVLNPGVYVDRESSACINVQAAADSRGAIVWFSAETPGSTHDHQAFSITGLFRRLQRLAAAAGFGLCLVGDAAYTAALFMWTPIRNAAAGTAEDNANYAQTKCRQAVERAFGMLERRWGVLWRRLEVRLAHVRVVIDTIVRLHNVCVAFNVPPADETDPAAFVPLKRISDEVRRQGHRADREDRRLQDYIVKILKEEGFRRPAGGRAPS